MKHLYFQKKEAKRNVGAISKRIASQEFISNISTIAEKVGSNGCTWSPCTYSSDRRTQKNFKEMPVICIRFR